MRAVKQPLIAVYDYELKITRLFGEMLEENNYCLPRTEIMYYVLITPAHGRVLNVRKLDDALCVNNNKLISLLGLL
jgi:hypothetical protein